MYGSAPDFSLAGGSTPERPPAEASSDTPQKPADVDGEGFETSTKEFTPEVPPQEGEICVKLSYNGPWPNYRWASLLDEKDMPRVPSKKNKVPDQMASVKLRGNINRFPFGWNSDLQMCAMQFGTKGQYKRINVLAPQKYPVR